MARKPRIQYPGAICHILSREDRGWGELKELNEMGFEELCSGLAKETWQNAETHRPGQEICELENRPGPGTRKRDQRHQSVDSPTPEHGASEQRKSSY